MHDFSDREDTKKVENLTTLNLVDELFLYADLIHQQTIDQSQPDEEALSRAKKKLKALIVANRSSHAHIAESTSHTWIKHVLQDLSAYAEEQQLFALHGCFKVTTYLAGHLLEVGQESGVEELDDCSSSEA